MLGVFLSPCLISETLCVPELGVLRFLLNSSVEILMCKIVVPLVKMHIASVEVHQWVIRLFLDRLIEILLGKVVLSYMIVSEATVIIMEWMLLKSN